MQWNVTIEVAGETRPAYRFNTVVRSRDLGAIQLRARMITSEMGFEFIGARVGFEAHDELLPLGERVVDRHGLACRVVSHTELGDVWVSYSPGMVSILKRYELVTLDSLHAAAIEYDEQLAEQRHQLDAQDALFHALAV